MNILSRLGTLFLVALPLVACGASQDVTPNDSGTSLHDARPDAPRAGGEQCDDGIDNDADGTIDEECPCVPGAMQPCWPGDLALRGVTGCADGTQQCVGQNEFGTWGACLGAVTSCSASDAGSPDSGTVPDASDDDGPTTSCPVPDAPCVTRQAESRFHLPEADCDDDGVPNSIDNCYGIANADQADADHDGNGDACAIAVANCARLRSATPNTGVLDTSFEAADLRGCEANVVWQSLRNAQLSCARLTTSTNASLGFEHATARRIALLEGGSFGSNDARQTFVGADLREAHLVFGGGHGTMTSIDFSEADLSNAYIENGGGEDASIFVADHATLVGARILGSSGYRGWRISNSDFTAGCMLHHSSILLDHVTAPSLRLYAVGPIHFNDSNLAGSRLRLHVDQTPPIGGDVATDNRIERTDLTNARMLATAPIEWVSVTAPGVGVTSPGVLTVRDSGIQAARFCGSFDVQRTNVTDLFCEAGTSACLASNTGAATSSCGSIPVCM